MLDRITSPFSFSGAETMLLVGYWVLPIFIACLLLVQVNMVASGRLMLVVVLKGLDCREVIAVSKLLRISRFVFSSWIDLYFSAIVVKKIMNIAPATKIKTQLN